MPKEDAGAARGRVHKAGIQFVKEGEKVEHDDGRPDGWGQRFIEPCELDSRPPTLGRARRPAAPRIVALTNPLRSQWFDTNGRW